MVVISRSYIARPAISEKRLSLSPQRKVPYQLKTAWKSDTTHVEFEPLELMAHIPVHHPAGDLRSSKSAILPICHRQTRGSGAATARAPHPLPRRFTTGILPFALRASLRLFKFAPGEFVRQTRSCARS